MSDARTDWKNQLGRTSDCIPIESLGEMLTPREREHLGGCPRCQAEMALWNEFDANEMRMEDEDDVHAIAAQLRHGNAAGASNVVPIASRRAAWPRLFAVAATLVIAIAIGYVMQNREPSVNIPIGENAYRSAAVEVIAPKGDVSRAPADLRWTAVRGALQYEVVVLEVDRTVLWRTTTPDTHVMLPAPIAEQFVPGKTILWQVTARRDRTVIAQSGMQRFRVKTP